MNSIYNWSFKSLCLFAVVSFLKVVGANIFLGLSTLLFLAFLAKNREHSIAEDTVPFCRAIMIFVIALFISAANDANGIHGVVPSIASVMPAEINFLNFLCIKSNPFVLLDSPKIPTRAE